MEILLNINRFISCDIFVLAQMIINVDYDSMTVLNNLVSAKGQCYLTYVMGRYRRREAVTIIVIYLAHSFITNQQFL